MSVCTLLVVTKIIMQK